MLTTTSFPLPWRKELTTQLGWAAFNWSCACQCIRLPYATPLTKQRTLECFSESELKLHLWPVSLGLVKYFISWVMEGLTHTDHALPGECCWEELAARSKAAFGSSSSLLPVFPISLSTDQNLRSRTLVSYQLSKDTACFWNHLNKVWLADSTASGGQSLSQEHAGCPGVFHGNAVTMRKYMRPSNI